MPGTTGLPRAGARGLGLQEGEELIPMAANVPKALPENCSGSTLRQEKLGMGWPRCPTLRGPAAGAGAVPQPHMALLEDAPTSAGAALGSHTGC